jgi:hypothetical protein
MTPVFHEDFLYKQSHWSIMAGIAGMSETSRHTFYESKKTWQQNQNCRSHYFPPSKYGHYPTSFSGRSVPRMPIIYLHQLFFSIQTHCLKYLYAWKGGGETLQTRWSNLGMSSFSQVLGYINLERHYTQRRILTGSLQETGNWGLRLVEVETMQQHSSSAIT